MQCEKVQLSFARLSKKRCGRNRGAVSECIGGGRYDWPWGQPFDVARGEGSGAWGITGNEYIDCSQASGSMIHGDNLAASRQTVLEAIEIGAYRIHGSELHHRPARILRETIRSAERVRLWNT